MVLEVELGMKGWRAWRHRGLVFAHDLVWVPVALAAAWWLRFNLGPIPDMFVEGLIQAVIVAVPMQAAAFAFFGLYRGIWRYASLPDLLRILKAVAVGSACTFAVLFVWNRMSAVPRSVMLLYPMMLVLGLAGPRLLYRWLKDRRLDLRGEPARRALIVGAGRAGELLVRDLLKGGEYQPVGFVDDDPRKHGQEIQGVRVLGGVDRLEALARELAVDVVLLAMPSASRQAIRRVVEICQRLGVSCRTLPSVADLADGKVEVGRLRRVGIEDLLGREPVRMDHAGVRGLIEGTCVLVTGAGGSIGSELCRQIAAMRPARLVMLDHGEFNLYRIDREMNDAGHGAIIEPVLGDVRDGARMRWLFERFRPDLVFNAAACKHVPLVEKNPAEGVKTNVLGTVRLADLAVEFGVRKFIQISTDKAVNPTNVMGATKRAAEIYCQNLDRRSPATAFVTTRFGNVLGSAGSVVPLFQEQIEKGGPVTVTHPEVTRYFMTIPEAVSLILQAALMGRGGEIFVLDMGEPVRILDLAEQMIRLSGLEPGRDVEIVFTGLRPGEKLYEELFHEAESLVGTDHPKLMLAASREADWSRIEAWLKRLDQACTARDIDTLLAVLREMVPEYASPPPGAMAATGRPGALH
ncbi:MAG: nucleoside-diphosphate sugar epimerase/dehydratase [Mariprofundaceae bacterium]